MLRVGLTGGIGSGKSAVAELFARRGVPVVDTDEISREVVKPGTPGLAEIVQTFGESVLDAHGALDRRALRERVFDDVSARRRLEAILHWRIGAAVVERVAALKAPYCLIVVPLLVETGFNALIDRLLVVDVDEERQIERTSARDRVAPEAVRKILAAQARREERLKRADDVILNNGTLEELDRAVEQLHARYLALARTAEFPSG
ncbi:MAG: dephospho-CoA kinase [Sulfurifustaceae bacterium]